MVSKQIIEAALKLPEDERAALVERLLERFRPKLMAIRKKSGRQNSTAG